MYFFGPVSIATLYIFVVFKVVNTFCLPGVFNVPEGEFRLFKATLQGEAALLQQPGKAEETDCP